MSVGTCDALVWNGMEKGQSREMNVAGRVIVFIWDD